MVIALSGVQFGLKSYVCNHKYDFRPKLHDPKFNYHFIRSILKSHNLIAQIQELQDFGQYQLFSEPSYQICQTMAFLSFIFLQCDWLV